MVLKMFTSVYLNLNYYSSSLYKNHKISKMGSISDFIWSEYDEDTYLAYFMPSEFAIFTHTKHKLVKD
jgi:hypothetical protein